MLGEGYLRAFGKKKLLSALHRQFNQPIVPKKGLKRHFGYVQGVKYTRKRAMPQLRPTFSHKTNIELA